MALVMGGEVVMGPGDCLSYGCKC